MRLWAPRGLTPRVLMPRHDVTHLGVHHVGGEPRPKDVQSTLGARRLKARSLESRHEVQAWRPSMTSRILDPHMTSRALASRHDVGVFTSKHDVPRPSVQAWRPESSRPESSRPESWCLQSKRPYLTPQILAPRVLACPSAGRSKGDGSRDRLSTKGLFSRQDVMGFAS